MSDGTQRIFRRDGQSCRFVLQVEEPTIHQRFEVTDENTVTQNIGGVTRLFRKISHNYYLSQITQSGGISIEISHDPQGKITRVTSGPSIWVALQWSEGKDPRLVGVADSAGRHVAFRQDGRWLRSVVDPTGAESTYDYVNDLLSSAKDPTGRLLLRERYDKLGRVQEASTGMGFSHYDYQSSSSDGSIRTVVTDPSGVATAFEHNNLGAISAITDSSRTVRLEYGRSNRPTRIWDSMGADATFTYDSQNHLVSQTRNGIVDRGYSYGSDGQLSSIVGNGEQTDLTLDSRGQIVRTQSSDPTRTYTTAYNQQGQVTSLKSSTREVSFEYDSNGNETAVAYSDLGRFSLQRDAAGDIVGRQFPSGLSYSFSRDARGAVTSWRDNHDHLVTVEYDASGAPMAYIRADGKRMSAVRDEAGRVIAITGFDGRVRLFDYNARGALTDYTDVNGKHRKYQYGRDGRLNTIVYDDGVTTKVERDDHGHILRLNTARTQLGVINSSSPLSEKRRWAHGLMFQDPPEPPPGEPIDVLVTDTWAPYWPGGSSGGGGMHPPLQSTDTDAGTGGGPAPYDPLDCAASLASCAAAIIAYPALVVALDVACPETFGITCLLALLALPVGGLVAALVCAKAIRDCHVIR
jgi:YD repeat-containing protein